MVESLRILFYGLGIAIVVGVPLAILMARFRPVDWALDLPVNAMYATPMVALVPLLVLWFGIYMEAKIIVVFLFCVFPIPINTYQACANATRTCSKWRARSAPTNGACGATCCFRSRCHTSPPA